MLPKNDKVSTPPPRLTPYKSSNNTLIQYLFLAKIIIFAALFLIACSRDNGARSATFTPHQEKELWGFVDEQQNVVIRHRFEQVGYFFEDRARVKVNGRWGYINGDGIIRIPIEYHDATDFHNGVARVKKTTKWGAINKKGETIADFKFDSPDAVVVEKK